MVRIGIWIETILETGMGVKHICHMTMENY